MWLSNFKSKKMTRNQSLKRRFVLNSSGTTLVTFALSLPVLLGAVGVGVDFGTLSMKRSNLQAAGDAAALAGAKELSLASATDSSIKAAALAFLSAQLVNGDSAATGEVLIDRSKGNVTVKVTEVWAPFFAQFLSSDVTPVLTSSTASLAGETKVCILSLASSGPLGFSMLESAHVLANGCGIYSNSTDKNSMYLGGSSTVKATLLCSSGGIYNKGGSTDATVLTDCPPIPDPLALRAPPPVGACTYTNMSVSSGNVVLKPGVYCGGLKIDKTAVVTFSPGTYIVKDGLFLVRNTASVKGKDVAFYFTGTMALLWFLEDAAIDLSGAETGPLAGLLFFDDPKANSFLRVHTISSTHAHTLTGTIYLPHAALLVNPYGNVGEDSAYTAIVAERLAVEKGPNLVLNSDYNATSVPVPAGIRSTTSVVLTN